MNFITIQFIKQILKPTPVKPAIMTWDAKHIYWSSSDAHNYISNNYHNKYYPFLETAHSKEEKWYVMLILLHYSIELYMHNHSIYIDVVTVPAPASLQG